MSGRFQIEHPKTGSTLGLSSVKVFHEQYEPQGYVISKEQPYGWEAPAIDKPKREAKSESKQADADSK